MVICVSISRPASRVFCVRPVCWLVALLWLAGCNQNPANRYGSPWGGPTTPGSPGAADPYAAAPVGQGPLQSLLNRRRYIADLQARADAQTRLAAEQESRLAQLKEMQRLNDDQLAQYRDQQLQGQQAKERERLQQEQLLAQRAREALGRYDELGKRADGLDRTNQDLQARMAQMEQHSQLLADENHLLRQRLDDTNHRLAGELSVRRQTDEKLQTLTASARKRSGASITANNSFRQNLTAVSVEGLAVRQDGDLVRIELPTDRLFEPGTARLRSDANLMIDQVANVITANYSRQIIGVEAHTDNTPLAGTMWRNSHQLTAAQAMAVFEQLSYRHRLLPQQLFVLGHGENYPLASNATPAGQSRNRRVEIVIYPDVVGQR